MTNEPSNRCEFALAMRDEILILTLASTDGLNRLSRQKVIALAEQIDLRANSRPVSPLIITGMPIFSAGADLNEIAALGRPEALRFAQDGQRLMGLVESYPGPVIAAVRGFCMGGGLDLALACRHRIASPDAVFGHRGAALGLITGWGGTQRLPRLVGKSRALQMFIEAEKVRPGEALRIGLVDAISDHPVEEAIRRIRACRG